MTAVSYDPDRRCPVLRHSYPEEAAEGFWTPLPFRERVEILDAARAWSRKQREQGKEPLTASMLHVLQVMFTEIWPHGDAGEKGAFDHAIDYIALKAQRCRQTVVATLQRLRDHGFLEYIRRCRRGDEDGGPKWVQATNAYRFRLPPAIREFWESIKAKRAARKAARTTPEDAETAAAAREAQRQQMGEWDHERAHGQKVATEALRATAHLVQGPGAAAYRAKLLE